MKYSPVGCKTPSKQKRVKQRSFADNPLRSLVNTDNEIPGIPYLVISIANSVDIGIQQPWYGQRHTRPWFQSVFMVLFNL